MFNYNLTLLHAALAHTVHANLKFARGLLKRLISSSSSKDPPHLVYSSHLALVDTFLSPPGSLLYADTTPKPAAAHKLTPQDLQSALAAIGELQHLAIKNAHPQVILLTHVIRLRTLISTESWDQVSQTLANAEQALGLSYLSIAKLTTKPSPEKSTPVPSTPPTRPKTFITFTDPFEFSMAIHTLLLGILWFTHAGLAVEAGPRLSHLHALLDEGAANANNDGTVEVCSYSLFIFFEIEIVDWFLNAARAD